ncbi:MAG TPA: YiiX/YebB-like N1pC/P60 family cysteine hydrolase [Noviherbaspirillum sp.]|jgi:hypothetical protein|uniref:YiiX/YebB-like N1pC/P60 family cysteine hydrolase n=1 Tax=Noviherbaspirillum sp. TaxID=1926288 RepID=UPI002F946C6F
MNTTDLDDLPRRKYEDMRNEMRTGDIVFTSGNYPVSRVIRHFSGSLFSHVGFVFPWNKRVLLVESVEDDGVRAVPLSQYVHDYECCGKPYDGRIFLARHRRPFSETDAEQLLGIAADKLNRKYDKEEIGRILARVTLGIGKPGQNDAYICSEFVDVCFQQIGIRFPRHEKGFIFPEHIASDPDVDCVCEFDMGPQGPGTREIDQNAFYIG